MKVSVLTPSYNYAHYFRDCLTSVEQQRSGPVQHVVHDNVSTDGTVDLLRRADPAIVTWVSERDAGQSDALNRALGRATGDVIGWLNADEFYLPWAVETVCEVFEAQPDVDVVYGDTVFCDADGRFERLQTRIPLSLRLLRRRGCYISTCSLFIRRNAMDGFRFDERLRVLMDWDLLLHLAHRDRTFVYLPSPLGVFRAHDARVTAGPSDRDSGEHLRVRARYGISDGPSAVVSRALADTEYRLRKEVSGASLRERRASGLAGRPLVWMDGAEPGLAATAELRR
jgi:glycosyltransferase involved in cell wall biosynthesis